jgi:hypothetical protein
MYVKSQNSYAEGGCTVSYSVKIGFFSMSFSASYTKRISGAESNSSGSSGGGGQLADDTTTSDQTNNAAFEALIDHHTQNQIRAEAQIVKINTVGISSQASTTSVNGDDNNSIDLSDIFEDDSYQTLNREEWGTFYNYFYKNSN